MVITMALRIVLSRKSFYQEGGNTSPIETTIKAGTASSEGPSSLRNSRDLHIPSEARREVIGTRTI